MELLLLALLLVREIVQAKAADGNYSDFLNLEEIIPPYSGEKLFNHSCVPDEEAFEIVRDLQLSAQEKATYLHENLCRIDANLMCDEGTRRCVCMSFGGSTAEWDSSRVSCFGLVGSSCKTFTKFHPGVSRRLMHTTDCVVGASCANFVYDTDAVCQCDDDKKTESGKNRCAVSTTDTGGINLPQYPFPYSFFLISLIFQRALLS
jgi:hypothetical protein